MRPCFFPQRNKRNEEPKMNLFAAIKFRRDANLVEAYTGATLTREQFDAYSGGGTLRKKLGSDRDIYREYYGYGTPSEISQADVRFFILDTLQESGVVFDLGLESNPTPLFEKMMSGINASLANNRRPSVPNPYKSDPRLVEPVRNLRKARHLSIDGPVL